MAQFSMKIAGYTGQIQSMFDSTPAYFRDYCTQNPPDFSFTVTPQCLDFEQMQLDVEADREVMRRRSFTGPFLERASIHRAFSDFLLPHRVLALHGSAVAVDGQGYLFLAKSGTGKSTHTRLWQAQFGSRVILVNDDQPFVELTPDGVTLYGSPWSGKHGLHTNCAVPLRGICLLRRGNCNAIQPLSPAAGLPDVLHESHPPLDPGLQAMHQELVLQLTQCIPLWKLQCTPAPEAAQISYEAMSGQRL